MTESHTHLMEKQSLREGMAPPSSKNFRPVNAARQLRRFGLATGILLLAFIVPLWDLLRFAASSDLYSYILLIPFISLYLLYLKRHNFPVSTRPNRLVSAFFLLVGLALAGTYWFGLGASMSLAPDDYLMGMMISFLLCFWGVCCRFWGAETLRAAAFPLGFLVFMVPIPTVAVTVIDSFLQSGSATVARGLFTLFGTPFLQYGLVFQLPSITITIASECSGIHSSLVLLITSLLAGYVFLKSPQKRIIFILAVVPLGILRNGFRIFTIGELCTHIGPQMIDSPIHHRGGPIFFALSLIPLFILLMVLRKSETSGKKSNSPGPKPNL
jgi:exosortase C (VPDSG-CTERM-specific)